MAENWEIWNKYVVKPPPNLTYKQNMAYSELRILSNACWDALTTLQNQEVFHTEAATLSRMIYRLKNGFRSDKGLKCMEKLNHCLRHYLSLDLVPIYENIFRSVPWESNADMYCPSLQMLEYVMIRTQGLAALLCRTVHTCHEAAFFLNSRISSGHNWQMAFLSLGVVSRIWSISKHLLDCSIVWYSSMYPFLAKLKHAGALWLPEGYVFPQHLKQWLAMPWLSAQEELSLPAKSMHTQSEVYSSPEESTDTNKNQEVDSQSEELVMPSKSFTTSHVPVAQRVAELIDVGESISRKDVSAIKSRGKKLRKQRNKERNNSSVSKIEAKENAKDKLKGKKKNDNDSIVEVKNINVASCSVLGSTAEWQGKGNEQKVGDQKKKSVRKPKIENKISLEDVVLSIQTQADVQAFLKRETKTRCVTSSLDEKQWSLLKKMLEKVISKLNKTSDSEKQTKLMKQVEQALRLTLT